MCDTGEGEWAVVEAVSFPDDSVRVLSGGAGAAWAEAGTRSRESKSMMGHTEASPLS